MSDATPPPQDPFSTPPPTPPAQPPAGPPPVPPPPSAPGGYGAPPGYGAPAPGYGGPMSQPPQNYLVWSILTTLFCCLPLGVVSIVFAAQVNSKWAMGDFAGATESSNKAKQWAIWSAIASVVGLVLYLIFFLVLGVFASSS